MKDKEKGLKFQKTGWLLGLFLGVLFLGVGLYFDQYREIFIKATRICLECIGIG